MQTVLGRAGRGCPPSASLAYCLCPPPLFNSNCNSQHKRGEEEEEEDLPTEKDWLFSPQRDENRSEADRQFLFEPEVETRGKRTFPGSL